MESFLVGERHINYTRPSQVRKIPLTTMSNRGMMPSLKPHLENVIIEYESQLEHEFYLLLDHDPNCYDLQPQPYEISYRTKTGRETTAVPDCWAIFTNGREFIFDIKPDYQLQKLISDENWQLRVEAVQEFCKR
ncbi:MAG: TnsA endonuclease N-terminal domain-containing protein [Candidatus Helarchaeota archaeon]